MAYQSCMTCADPFTWLSRDCGIAPSPPKGRGNCQTGVGGWTQRETRACQEYERDALTASAGAERPRVRGFGSANLFLPKGLRFLQYKREGKALELWWVFTVLQ